MTQFNNDDLNKFHRKKSEEIRKAAAILGSIKSEKKAKASKQNGKLGGRGWTKQKREKNGNIITKNMHI